MFVLNMRERPSKISYRAEAGRQHAPGAWVVAPIHVQPAQPAHAADRLPRRVLSILALVSHLSAE